MRAILILAAAVFFRHGIVVTEIQQAHLLLAPLLGTAAAGILFAVALLCSGQSSTLTGTLAGQIVMEGFLNIRMRPWLRRLITRTLAIIPAALTIYISGDKGTYQLLILSQVILSMQLPFAVIPLIHFTSDRAAHGRVRQQAVGKMAFVGRRRADPGAEHLAAGRWHGPVAGLLRQPSRSSGCRWLVAGRGAGGSAALDLVRTADRALGPARFRPRVRSPFRNRPRSSPPRSNTTGFWCRSITPTWIARPSATPPPWPRCTAPNCTCCTWKKASPAGSTGRCPPPRKWRPASTTCERIAESLRAEGIDVETAIVHAPRPGREIVRYASEIHPDLDHHGRARPPPLERSDFRQYN